VFVSLLVDFSELELLGFAALVVLLCFIKGSFSVNSLGFTFLITVTEVLFLRGCQSFLVPSLDAMLQKVIALL